MAATLGGFFLIAAGVLFPLTGLAAAPDSAAAAQFLAGRRTLNFIYAGAALLSNLLIAPVLVQLSIRLYPVRRGTAVAGGTLIGLAVILETVAVLLSLARWSWAIPAAARGEPAGIHLFDTLQTLWLAVDLPGAALFYVAAIVYAAGMRRLDRAAAGILAGSAVLFLLGGLLSPLVPLAGALLTAGSIVVYGIAYVALGALTVRLERGLLPEMGHGAAGSR